jgi:hypothetical protein
MKLFLKELKVMFHEDVLFTLQYDNDTELQLVLSFYSEYKYRKFAQAKNKRQWLQVELGLDEYFLNTYIDLLKSASLIRLIIDEGNSFIEILTDKG